MTHDDARRLARQIADATVEAKTSGVTQYLEYDYDESAFVRRLKLKSTDATALYITCFPWEQGDFSYRGFDT